MPTLRTTLTKLCSSCGYRYETSLERCPLDGARLGRERADVSQIGPYRLIERLGTGGMGVVYRAIHEKLGRTVAIKMLHKSMAADRVNVARFFQEARAVNTIRHPNVVDIYDFVSAGGEIYMVMEFLVGRDLHQGLYAEGGRPFTVDRVVGILEQVCGALQSAHARNIIHRDLKPANVFLTRRNNVDDFVKLLDFGLAKLDRSDGRMTKDGVVLGTPEYMAPEQARGHTLDNRTDLYAVGCIAYQMLTGCQLFAGGNYADVMVRHVKETAPPVRDLNPAVPESLEATVMRCLAKNPAERPQTALDLAQELCRAINRPFDTSGAFGQHTPAVRMTPITLGLGSGRHPEFDSMTLNLRRSSRRVVTVGGVVVMAALGTGAALFGRPGRSQSAAKSHTYDAPAATAPHGGPEMERLVAVKLQSHPPGAAIYNALNIKVGVTPFDLIVPFGTEQRVRFVYRGYKSYERDFRADADTTIAVVLETSDSDDRTVRAAAAPPVRGRRRRGDESPPTPDKPAPPDRDLDSRARTLNPFSR